MTAADFDAKAADAFAAAARPLSPQAPQRLREIVDGLESLEDVRGLVELFRPIPTQETT